MNELDRELREAGGLDASPTLSARLRRLLLSELERGSAELLQTRSGYGAPICVALTPGERQVVALLPAPAELRADPGAVVERAATVVTATVEALVEAASPGALLATRPKDAARNVAISTFGLLLRARLRWARPSRSSWSCWSASG